MSPFLSKSALATAIAFLALPVMAGPTGPFGGSAKPAAKASAAASVHKSSMDPTPSRDGFEPVGGEPGWQLAPHRLELRDGHWVHSEACDHEMRPAQLASAKDLDAALKLSPGR